MQHRRHVAIEYDVRIDVEQGLVSRGIRPVENEIPRHHEARPIMRLEWNDRDASHAFGRKHLGEFSRCTVGQYDDLPLIASEPDERAHADRKLLHDLRSVEH